jgi:hypothetical protein
MNTFSCLASNLVKSPLNPNSITYINSSSVGVTLASNGTIVATNLSSTTGYSSTAWGINPSNQNTTFLTLQKGSGNLVTPTTSNFTFYMKHSVRLYTNPIFGHGYKLTTSDTSVNSGNSFTVSFYSLYPIINLPYTISGVASSDLNGASLTGSFTNYYQSMTYTVSTSMAALNTFSMLSGTQTVTVTLTNPNPGLPVVQYLFQSNLTNSGTGGSSNNAIFGNVSTVSGSASLSSSSPISGSLSYNTINTRKGRTYSIYDNTGTTCNYIITSLTGLDFSSGMTICAWYNISTLPSSRNSLIKLLGPNYNYNFSSNDDNFALDALTSSALQVFGIANIISSITLDSWFHVALVYSISGSTTTLKSYINGSLRPTPYQTTSPTPFVGSLIASSLGIFGIDTNNNTLRTGIKGYLDDFRIYNSALTASQVTYVYNN